MKHLLAVMVMGCLSLSWFLPVLAVEKVPDLEAAIRQYKAENKEKYDQLAPETKAVIAKAKTELAQQMPNPGLPIGKKAPDFTLPNADGKSIQLYNQLQKGPVILVFYRGAWCPFCNLQLHAYQQALPMFKQYSATLIAVTPQQPDHSAKQLQKNPMNFEVLSDLDSTVMKAYQLHFNLSTELSQVYIQDFKLDLAEYNGKGRYELPVPGTFVIDPQGIIRAKFADPDYTKRMEPRDILAALKAMQGK
jgi:peroxiredoxin